MILRTTAPTVTRVWINDGAVAVGTLFTSTLRWLYTHSVIALGMLWLVAPDLTRVWLGPGHDRIAMLIRLWVFSYAMHLAWSLGAAFARSVGKPWIEVGSLAASLVTNIALGLWCVPRYGTVGAVAVLAVSYGAGFLTFVTTSARSGIPFGPWVGRELAPRVLLGAVTVALSAGLLAVGRLSGVLPPPGWIHGAVAILLYTATFALCFMPLGDTQRLAEVVRHMTAEALGRNRMSGR
jgi:O-antigen/teichoic acid export membrane protein